MYAPATQTQTGTGTSTAIALDDFQAPFNVGIIATVTGSVSAYTLEYSLDDPMTVLPANATWAAAPNFSALSATASGAFSVPSKAIRINIATGTGTVVLKVIQAGPV